MAVFAISDLHLALSIDKPMDIFGSRWSNYMEKIEKSWTETVSSRDYVVIPGDISWATYLDQASADFAFIDNLPGMKIISKGNHDYWWTTIKKLEEFISANNFRTIRFMHNNSYVLEEFALCGTRGWKCPGDDEFDDEDLKIYRRELQRLQMSLKDAKVHNAGKLVAALHYPPFDSKGGPSQFVEIMQDSGVHICLYGHLHGESFRNAVTGIIDGIDYRLVSADYLNFRPAEL